MISFWAFSALINFVTSTFLGLFVYLKNKKQPLNITYALFCLGVSVWSFSYLIWQISDTYNASLFWCRALMAGAIFTPIFYLHHLLFLLRLSSKKHRLIIFSYLFGLVFSLINVTPYFVKSVSKKMWFSFWPDAGPLFLPFCIVWFGLCIYGVWIVAKSLCITKGVYKTQLRYVLIATIIGWTGAFTNFPLWFNINIPPFGNIFVSIYVAVVAYAIIKYRLLDIGIAITRAGIFVFVYTLVLGIPFYCAYSLGLWKYSLWIMMVLATTGPFIYLFLQKKAEEQLLIEQHQYQTTLQQASLGMGQIKNLKRLLNLIVHIVTRAVGIEHCEIYLLHEDSGQFTLKASRGWSIREEKQVSVLNSDSLLISYLKESKESIVYDEVEKRMRDNDGKKFESIETVIRELDGSLIVPSFMDQKLIAVLVLGRKLSGKIYTHDDMAVFSILANQAALAIENAQFYEKMKETHQQLLKAEKMATVGTMADGLSHQINNRLHAMGFIAGDVLDTINLKKKGKLSSEVNELLGEIEHSLKRIEVNVKRGGEIVEGLLKYTRKGSEGFEAISLNKLLDASWEMAQFKIKVNEMNMIRAFDHKTPKIKGNFTQLQEVFFNIIDNAYDAMMQRKSDLKEPEYKANLEISAHQKNGKLEILIQDNGIGVKKENLEKLFTPFFTTKLSSKKGTGLGLYVIRQVIEENHGGKVEFTSEYKKGSQTRIILPIAK